MGIVKVLKRKDAASVIVAVVIGMVLLQLVTQLTAKLAGQVIGLEEGQYISYSTPDATWQATYLLPVVTSALQLIALEVTIWVYVFLSGLVGKK